MARGRKSTAKTMIEKIQEDGSAVTPPEGRDAKDIKDEKDPSGPVYEERFQLPIESLVPSPDQYCAVDKNSEAYRRTKASIASIGIKEDLLVRPHQDPDRGLQKCRKALGVNLYEVLSGHSRREIALELGMKFVPCKVIRGLSDADAFDLMAAGNIRKELSPFEWGKLVDTWLTKYGQNAKAVGSSLGKTEHWVLTHAMIEHLIAGWKEEAVHREPRNQYSGHYRRDYSHWTAEHWRHIARLPAAIQQHWLDKIKKDYRFDPHDASADKVAEWLKTEKLFLAKAPFDWETQCNGCDKRTDAICQTLWADDDLAKAEEGQAVRCLDPKCWQRKGEKKVREDFKTTAKGFADRAMIDGGPPISEILPISMIEVKTDWHEREAYEKKIRPLKRAFSKALVTADRVKVVTEGAKGAVPGIVVAGDKKHKKDSLVWVKIAKKQETSSGGMYRPSKAQVEENARREKDKAQARAIFARLAEKRWEVLPEPKLAIILLLTVIREDEKKAEKAIRLFGRGPDAFYLWYAERLWKNHREDWENRARWAGGYELDKAKALAGVLGVEVPKEEENAKDAKGLKDAKDKTPGTCPIENKTGECDGDGNCKACPRNAGETPGKKKRGRPKKGKEDHHGDTESTEKKAKKTAGAVRPKCRVCGCTDDDCSQCIAKTGKPCTWIERNGENSLCSACAGADPEIIEDDPGGEEEPQDTELDTAEELEGQGSDD